MATGTKKSSPDYDPSEQAMMDFFNLGREQERTRTEPKVEAARRGGARTGAASANRRAEEDRQRRAQKQRNAQARMRGNRAARDEERTAAARRGAFASGQAKAKRDAASQSRSLGGGAAGAAGGGKGAALGAIGGGEPAKLSAPTVVLPGNMGGGLTREGGARIIIVIVGLCAVSSVAASAVSKAPGKVTIQVGKERVPVPQHLRSLGGVFVAGTISLVANEISPGLGVALALILGLDVFTYTLLGKGGLFNRLGGGVFRGALPVPRTTGGGVALYGPYGPDGPGGAIGTAPPAGPAKATPKPKAPPTQLV
jgi:hypothetical protein